MYFKYLNLLLLRGFGLALAFSLNIYIARNFTKEAVGEYFILLQLLTLLSTFARYGSDNALLKYAQYFNCSEKKQLLFNSIKNAFYVFLIVLIFCCLFGFFIFDSCLVIYFTLLLLLPYSFIIYCSEYLKGSSKQNKAMMLQTAAIPCMTIIFIVLGFSLLMSYFYSVVFVFTLAIFVYNSKPLGKEHNKDVVCEFKGTLFVFFKISIINIIIATTDSLMLGVFVSPEAVADYNLTAKLVALSSVLLVIVNGVVGPFFSQKWIDEDIDRIKEIFIRITITLAVVGFLILLVSIFFGEYILELLYGKGFKHLYKMLVVLALAQFFVLSTGPVAYLLMMTGNSKIHEKSLLISLVVNVTLNLFLIPIYGPIGAATASAITLIIKNLYSFNKTNAIFKFI